MSRRNSRKMAFKILFQADQVKTDINDAFDLLLTDEKVNEEEKLFAKELIDGVLANQEIIDMLIEKYSQKWTLDRMFSIDRVILRLGCYEIMYNVSDAPIAINEAVELSKIYGEEKSPGYVNAILDKVRKYHEQITEPSDTSM